MSLEIGEIGVKMAVGGHHEKPAAGGAGDTATLTPALRAQLVQECVRQVLGALRKAEVR